MQQNPHYQYMYMNGNFYFRFMFPSIPPSYWVQLKDEALLKIMREEGEREHAKLKNELMTSLEHRNPNMYKLVTTFRENSKDISHYYSPSNYEQYKRDIATRMYLRGDCVIADPLHMM